jgi:hypothetical protein
MVYHHPIPDIDINQKEMTDKVDQKNNIDILIIKVHHPNPVDHHQILIIQIHHQQSIGKVPKKIFFFYQRKNKHLYFRFE